MIKNFWFKLKNYLSNIHISLFEIAYYYDLRYYGLSINLLQVLNRSLLSIMYVHNIERNFFNCYKVFVINICFIEFGWELQADYELYKKIYGED